MCKLIVGVNQKPNNKEFEKYIEAQQIEMFSEKDGCSALVIDFDNKTHIFRSLNDYNAVFRAVYEVLSRAKLVSIHTRTGTSGQKTANNVHFFEDNGHYMAHNGFVMKYHKSMGYTYHSEHGWNKDSTFYQSKLSRGEGVKVEEDVFEIDDLEIDGKNQYCKGCNSSKAGICKKHKRNTSIVLSDNAELCDTFQFLKSLEKPVTCETLEKAIKEKEFSGMGIIVNAEKPEAYLIVKKDVKLQTDKETFGIFYSYIPDKESKIPSYENIWGVSIVKTNVVKTDLPVRTAFEGVYQLKI